MAFLKLLSGTIALVTLHFLKLISQCLSPYNGTVWAPLTQFLLVKFLLVKSRHTIGCHLQLVSASHTVVCYIQQFLTSPTVALHTPGSLLSLQAALVLPCNPYHFCNSTHDLIPSKSPPYQALQHKEQYHWLYSSKSQRGRNWSEDVKVK